MAEDSAAPLGDDTSASDPTPGRNLPSLYSNRFHVLMSDRLTRLTFGDIMDGGDSNYFVALMLDTENALDLARVINQVAADRAAAKQREAGGAEEDI